MCGSDMFAAGPVKKNLSRQEDAIRESLFTRKGAIDTVFTGGLRAQTGPLAKTALAAERSKAESSGALREKATPLDPVAEKARIAAQETSASNARIAMQRRAMRENSLFGGGVGGRSTLGV